MAIEIRELRIKVKIDDGNTAVTAPYDVEQMRQFLLKECKKEIKKQINKHKER